jgi:hypothetical protein
MNKFTDVLQRTISLAKAAYQARLTGAKADDSPLVASGSPSAVQLQTAEERALWEFLSGLSAPEVYLLTAVMYLGRGDFGPKDLPAQYEEVREAFGGQEWAERQMFDKMSLAEYLEQGSAKLARSRLDVDKVLNS